MTGIKKNQKFFKKALDFSKKYALSLESIKKSKKIQKFFILPLDISRYVMYNIWRNLKTGRMPRKESKMKKKKPIIVHVVVPDPLAPKNVCDLDIGSDWLPKSEKTPQNKKQNRRTK